MLFCLPYTMAVALQLAGHAECWTHIPALWRSSRWWPAGARTPVVSYWIKRMLTIRATPPPSTPPMSTVSCFHMLSDAWPFGSSHSCLSEHKTLERKTHHCDSREKFIDRASYSPYVECSYPQTVDLGDHSDLSFGIGSTQISGLVLASLVLCQEFYQPY